MLLIAPRVTPALAESVDPSTPHHSPDESPKARNVHPILASTKIPEALEHHVLGEILRSVARQELARMAKGKGGDFREKGFFFGRVGGIREIH
jgi:hypothetical protein